METQKLNNDLKSHGLRGTDARRKVLKVFKNHPAQALTSAEIEEDLQSSLDRITLYRTLRSFEESGLLHRVADGSDKIRFALCSSECTSDEHHDAHAHFYCKKCETTLCMESVQLPNVKAPKDYQIHAVQLALTGVCDKCQES